MGHNFIQFLGLTIFSEDKKWSKLDWIETGFKTVEQNYFPPHNAQENLQEKYLRKDTQMLLVVLKTIGKFN